MKAYFLKRSSKVSAKAVQQLEEKINIFKSGKIAITEIELEAIPGTYHEETKEKQRIDSFDIFNRIIKIGKLIEDKIEDESKIADKNISSEIYYQNCITKVLEQNIDKISNETFNFIYDYGYFVFENRNKYFSMIYFSYFCYLVYEIFTLYKSVIQYKPINIKLFLNYHNLQIKPISFYKGTDIDIVSKDTNSTRRRRIEKKISETITSDEEEKIRNEIFKIIESQIKIIEVNNNIARIKFYRDEEVDKFSNEILFNEKYNTEIGFTNPLAVIVYELKMQLSNDAQTSLEICRNKQCKNTFKASNKNSIYCGRKKCNRYRARQRKNQSLKRLKSVTSKNL